MFDSRRRSNFRAWTDPDGFFDVSDAPFGLDVQSGSVLQRRFVITGTVTGAVDGSIQTTIDFEGRLLIGSDSEVTVNGCSQTTGDAAFTNSGSIDAVLLGDGAGQFQQNLASSFCAARNKAAKQILPGGYDSDQTIFTVGGDFAFGEVARIGLIGPINSAYDFDGFACRATVGYDVLLD